MKGSAREDANSNRGLRLVLIECKHLLMGSQGPVSLAPRH